MSKLQVPANSEGNVVVPPTVPELPNPIPEILPTLIAPILTQPQQPVHTSSSEPTQSQDDGLEELERKNKILREKITAYYLKQLESILDAQARLQEQNARLFAPLDTSRTQTSTQTGQQTSDVSVPAGPQAQQHNILDDLKKLQEENQRRIAEFQKQQRAYLASLGVVIPEPLSGTSMISPNAVVTNAAPSPPFVKTCDEIDPSTQCPSTVFFLK